MCLSVGGFVEVGLVFLGDRVWHFPRGLDPERGIFIGIRHMQSISVLLRPFFSSLRIKGQGTKGLRGNSTPSLDFTCGGTEGMPSAGQGYFYYWNSSLWLPHWKGFCVQPEMAERSMGGHPCFLPSNPTMLCMCAVVFHSLKHYHIVCLFYLFSNWALSHVLKIADLQNAQVWLSTPRIIKTAF